MDNIKELTLLIPADTSVLGCFYIREFDHKGYLYNSADSKVFMLNGVDGIDLTDGTTYALDDEGGWIEIESPSIVTAEQLKEREELEEGNIALEAELAELEQKLANIPSAENINDVDVTN